MGYCKRIFWGRMGGTRIGAGGPRTGWVARGSELGPLGPDGWHADRSWGPADWIGGTRIGAGGPRTLVARGSELPAVRHERQSAEARQRRRESGGAQHRERRGPTQRSRRSLFVKASRSKMKAVSECVNSLVPVIFWLSP